MFIRLIDVSVILLYRKNIWCMAFTFPCIKQMKQMQSDSMIMLSILHRYRFFLSKPSHPFPASLQTKPPSFDIMMLFILYTKKTQKRVEETIFRRKGKFHDTLLYMWQFARRWCVWQNSVQNSNFCISLHAHSTVFFLLLLYYICREFSRILYSWESWYLKSLN